MNISQKAHPPPSSFDLMLSLSYNLSLTISGSSSFIIKPLYQALFLRTPPSSSFLFCFRIEFASFFFSRVGANFNDDDSVDFNCKRRPIYFFSFLRPRFLFLNSFIANSSLYSLSLVHILSSSCLLVSRSSRCIVSTSLIIIHPSALKFAIPPYAPTDYMPHPLPLCRFVKR